MEFMVILHASFKLILLYLFSQEWVVCSTVSFYFPYFAEIRFGLVITSICCAFIGVIIEHQASFPSHLSTYIHANPFVYAFVHTCGHHISQDPFKVSIFVSGGNVGDFPSLQMTYSATFDTFAPSDYFQLYALSPPSIRKTSLPLLSSLQRLSGFDSSFFLKWKHHFVEHFFKDAAEGSHRWRCNLPLFTILSHSITPVATCFGSIFHHNYESLRPPLFSLATLISPPYPANLFSVRSHIALNVPATL